MATVAAVNEPFLNTLWSYLMSKFRIFVVMIICIALPAAPVVSAQSGKGICKPDPTAPGGTTSNIKCVSSSCVGEMKIMYALNWCAPDEESPCTESPAYIYSTIQSQMKEGSWGSFISCTGTSVACASVGALFCLSPPWVSCLLGVAGTSLVCAGLNISSFDSCCWSTCVLDMATLNKVGGGRSC